MLVGVGACTLARVALLIQHATRMRCTLLWPLAQPYFSTFSHKGKMFGKKLLIIKYTFLFSLYLVFETLLILTIIPRVVVINVKTSSSKVPLFLVEF